MGNCSVAITGMGLVTALGGNVSENAKNMRLKKTGIRSFPQKGRKESCQTIAKVDAFAWPAGIPRKIANQMKFLNRSSLLGFTAAHEAMQTSGLDLSRIQPDRRALVLGTGDHTNTGYEFFHSAVQKGTDGTGRPVNSEQFNEACLHEVNPFYILESLHNNLFSFVSSFFELKGPNATLASLSPCGLHALETACRMIRLDHADAALVVGYGNWITEVPLFELQGLGLLCRRQKGAEGFRPLDRRRNGFIPGEGGAALLLEKETEAKKRGAFVQGRILGTGNGVAFDESDSLEPATNSTLKCMALTLQNAGLEPTDLGLILPHGNATRKGDRAEMASIQKLLGKHASSVPVAALKPYTGHIGAAGDIAEVILGIKSLQQEMAPATLHFHSTEERFSNLSVSSKHLPCHKPRFLSVSCGIGGQAAAVAVGV